jgi:hypothetical protein
MRSQVLRTPFEGGLALAKLAVDESLPEPSRMPAFATTHLQGAQPTAAYLRLTKDNSHLVAVPSSDLSYSVPLAQWLYAETAVLAGCQDQVLALP